MRRNEPTTAEQRTLLSLRLQAKEAVAAGQPVSDILLEINRVRALIEWPARVESRGNIEPYRFR